MSTPTRIVAIVSFRHSGSTLLGSALGASPSATFVGETDRILQRRGDGPPRCRCRRPIAECDHWSIGAAEIDSWPPRMVRDPRWFGIRYHLRRVLRRRGGEAEVQSDLWSAAADARDRVLVDSSKDLRLLRRQLSDARWSIDVVHLVRAPGPTVASCLRRGGEASLAGAGRTRRTITGVAELCRWTTLNLLVRPPLGRRARSMQRLRFEDLGRDPAGTVTALAESLGLEPPAFDGRTVITEEPHIVRANRGVHGGRTEIGPAGRSLEGLPRVVAALCRVAGRLSSDHEPHTRRRHHSGRTDASVRGQDTAVGSHT